MSTGELNEAIWGAASLAQTEIDRLMTLGYQELEAREVALREYVLLPEEPKDDQEARDIAAREAEYQRNPPPMPMAGTGDPNEA